MNLLKMIRRIWDFLARISKLELEIDSKEVFILVYM